VISDSQTRHILTFTLALSIAGLVVACSLAYHRPARPPIPNVAAQAEAVEKRTEHVYLIHVLTAGGEPSGPWICEQANVGGKR
jgi:hypothetical protein